MPLAEGDFCQLAAPEPTCGLLHLLEYDYWPLHVAAQTWLDGDPEGLSPRVSRLRHRALTPCLNSFIRNFVPDDRPMSNSRAA